VGDSSQWGPTMSSQGTGVEPQRRAVRGTARAPGPEPPAPVTIRHWTGVEIRAFRAAMRMSVRDFAGTLGVSSRVVSHWEAAGRAAKLRPFSQGLLDTLLTRATPEQEARFMANLATNDDPVFAIA